ncbi:hypothetical protein ANCCEY_10426 [Ancylostoma ceylanicum]|uniref:Peptidase M13 N-terminal domain-containing protein n=1 Tax=Ancylostoma ceylanicum TaxID=53326 RepID=A0A0D6LH36_9BILA|nr:hypothetical protein ANCCEY_10426 [Ancylostoma ceylanicum]
MFSASVILSSMNSSVDPCSDFYEYACGQWIRGHPIPDDAPSVSNFENLGQDLEFALKELLEEKIGREEAIDRESAIGKAKFFYKLCLNESEIFDNWRTTFDEVVAAFGGWPSLGHQLQDDVSIEKLYGDMVAKFRADSLFKATVQPDDKNSEKHVLLVRDKYFTQMLTIAMAYSLQVLFILLINILENPSGSLLSDA